MGSGTSRHCRGAMAVSASGGPAGTRHRAVAASRRRAVVPTYLAADSRRPRELVPPPPAAAPASSLSGGFAPASEARAASASGCSSSRIRASGSSSDFIHRCSHTKIAPNRSFAFGSFCIVADLANRQILLRRRPSGLVQPGDTELITTPAPEPAEGEALVRTTYVGLDAAVRTWLNDQQGYLPPVQLGEVIRAAGIGEVVESRCPAYEVGDVITMFCGFQEYVIVRDDE